MHTRSFDPITPISEVSRAARGKPVQPLIFITLRALRNLLIVICLLPLPVLAENTYTLVAAAYQGEFDNIMEMLDAERIDRVEEFNGTRFHVGSVHGYPIVVFMTGIGLTNAAMTTQLALNHYPAKRLLFSGVAGGLDPSLKKGDINVPSKWHFYEFGGRFTANPSAPRGHDIPAFLQKYADVGHFGNFFPYPMSVVRSGLDAPQALTFFEADPEMLRVVALVAQQSSFVNAHGDPARVLIGQTGGSGMAFNDDRQFSRFIRKTWGTVSVDMESAAIAQVCWVNQLPFLQIRGISDLVGNGSPNEFHEFKVVAEKNAARLLNLVLAARAF